MLNKHGFLSVLLEYPLQGSSHTDVHIAFSQKFSTHQICIVEHQRSFGTISMSFMVFFFVQKHQCFYQRESKSWSICAKARVCRFVPDSCRGASRHIWRSTKCSSAFRVSFRFLGHLAAVGSRVVLTVDPYVHLPDGRNHMAMVRLVTTLLNEWRKWRKCVPKSSELIRFFIREMDPHLLFRHVSACPLPGVRASLEP